MKWRPISNGSVFYCQQAGGGYDLLKDSQGQLIRYPSFAEARNAADRLNTQPLTLEEFAWRCLWLECGRLSQYVHFSYTLANIRELKRRAKRDELWLAPHFDKSEWAGMVRNWYADYLKTGVL
jgi:hypothetical protein